MSLTGGVGVRDLVGDDGAIDACEADAGVLIRHCEALIQFDPLTGLLEERCP